MIYQDHIRLVMDRTGFPEEAKACFHRIFQRIQTEDALRKAYYRILNTYLYECPDMKLESALDRVTTLAADYGENQFSMHMAFILSCTPRMYQLYEEEGIPEEIYWDSVEDLKYKLIECMECKGVPGTFVGSWFHGWFRLKRFALGRFQYEPICYDFGAPVTLPSGDVLMPGTPVANMHIPASGIPLTDAVRNDSYRRAYEFLSRRFQSNQVYLCCSSWLLFARHREFLPAHSNILKFMNDFHLTCSLEDTCFHDAWRVYGHYADGPVEDYPEDSSMQRAFKNWLLQGNHTGSGWGCMLLENGVNVTHGR